MKRLGEERRREQAVVDSEGGVTRRRGVGRGRLQAGLLDISGAAVSVFFCSSHQEKKIIISFHLFSQLCSRGRAWTRRGADVVRRALERR
jgi:hypothetical protein